MLPEYNRISICREKYSDRIHNDMYIKKRVNRAGVFFVVLSTFACATQSKKLSMEDQVRKCW
jgi:hypothetical protein